MKRGLALLLPLALVACQESTTSLSPTDARLAASSSGGLLPLPFGAQADRIVPGEVIVKLKDATDPASFARGQGLALGRMGYRGAYALLRVSRGSERAQAARLSALPNVEYAEPNYLRHPDGCSVTLWAFYNPGGCQLVFQNDPNGRDGQVVSGYDSTPDADEDASGSDVPSGFGSGGSVVTVGSIDTGVDFTHTEFASGQLIKGHDWIDGDNDPTDSDAANTEGHGTHTTGTMVGKTVGVAGVTGAGANVHVYVQRVCSGSGCPTSAIVNAIRAAADYGVVAMNLSLGGSFESRSEKDAIAYALSKNALVIASAGNDGSGRISCPACDSNAISVAALNWQDQLSYYSNYGSGLDLSAPGGEMYSNTTEDGGIYSAVPKVVSSTGYAYLQGTSMAAPQVTGTAGVVASKTGLKGAALRAQLEGTTDDLGAAGYDTSFGNGRINTYRAVTGSVSGGGGGGGGTCHGKKCQ